MNIYFAKEKIDFAKNIHQFILYDTFEERSPIQLTKLTDFTNFPEKIHISYLNYFPIDNNNFVFTKF